MIKINFSQMKTFSMLIAIAVLFISQQVNAQDSNSSQRAFQACLDHPDLQPHLKAVSFGQHKDVLAVRQNEYATPEIKLTQFGKEAIVSPITDLFFYSVEDYVLLSDVKTEQNHITVTITAGEKFTCTYDPKKGKVTKFKQSSNE